MGTDLLHDSAGTRGVVAGLDGGAHDARVLAAALEQATALNVELHAVHVLDIRDEPPPAADGPTARQWAARRQARLEAARGDIQRRLRAIAGDHAPAPAPRVRLWVGCGDPATVLLAAARDACLTVIGTHGGPARSPFLLGTVSQDVTVHATRPVLLVPWPAATRRTPGKVGRHGDGGQDTGRRPSMSRAGVQARA